MNLEALAFIGGGAVAILLAVVPLALWVRRRRGATRSTEPTFSRSGLWLMGVWVLWMLATAITAQMFQGVSKLAFAAAGLLAGFIAVTALGSLLERHGYPMFKRPADKSLERSREP